MKADLATKLVDIKPDQAKTEIKDIQHTARTALNEVRELVSNMRLIKLSEELLRVEQILIAADIKVKINGNPELKTTSILAENVDRKSTRLNSSHVAISYAVFCLKNKITYT